MNVNQINSSDYKVPNDLEPKTRLESPRRNIQTSYDFVELSTKQGKKTKGRSLLAIALGSAIAVFGGVLARKKETTDTPNKALEQIEQKFLRLEENIDNVQSTFKDVFLRSDITKEDAINMLRRYKEIEKLRITGSRNEYAQALFDEAKTNYGLANLTSSLSMLDKANPNVQGFTTPLGEVMIYSTTKKDKFLNVIHHELRHLKQRYCAFNLSPEDYVRFNQPKNIKIPLEIFECAMGGKGSKDNIPADILPFAQKSKDGILSYQIATAGLKEHLAQWIEKDAWNTGNKIEDLLRK